MTGVDAKLEMNQPPSKRSVSIVFLVLGIVVIFPWNCILDATDFYKGSAFPDHNWPLYSTQVYQTVFCITQVAMVMYGSLLGPFMQFLLPLIGCVVSTAVLIVAGLQDGDTDVRFMISLFALALLGASMGIMQAALFGVAAQGIKRFGNLPGQIMVGMGFAGIAAFALSLLGQVDSTKASFIVLFAAVIVLSSFTYLLFKAFKRTRDWSAQELLEENHIASEEGHTLGAEGQAMNQDVEEWTKCRSIYAGMPYELVIFMVFAVTFMVFPSQCALWNGRGPISGSSYTTFVMGTFQIMDTLGRWSAENISPVQRLGTPLPVWTLAILRVAFVPLFLLCAKSTSGALNTQAFQLVLMALFALSNGLTGSLAMQFAPRYVPAPARGVVGMAMTLALVGGIACGSYLIMPFKH